MNDGELRAELEACHLDAYGWALCCCRSDAASAEEALQAAYLKVLAGNARFNGHSAFKTWLFAVIRRTACEQKRKNILRRFFLQSYRPSTSGHPAPEQVAHEHEVGTLLEKALQFLPRRQSEILHLTFYQDLSLTEAARAMGISAGSARRHYHRAKQAMRDQLVQRIGHEAIESIRVIAEPVC